MRLLTAGLQVRVLPEEPCGAADLVICQLIPGPKRARFSRRRATSWMRPPSLPLGLGSSRAGEFPELGSAPWARALPLRQDLITPGWPTLEFEGGRLEPMFRKHVYLSLPRHCRNEDRARRLNGSGDHEGRSACEPRSHSRASTAGGRGFAPALVRGRANPSATMAGGIQDKREVCDPSWSGGGYDRRRQFAASRPVPSLLPRAMRGT